MRDEDKPKRPAAAPMGDAVVEIDGRPHQRPNCSVPSRLMSADCHTGQPFLIPDGQGGTALPLPAMRRLRASQEPWRRPYFQPRRMEKKPDDFTSTGAFRIVTAVNGAAMRPVFTYRNYTSSFATYSGKAERQQYCESATEMAALREAEIKTEYIDMQFQPARIEWLQPDGKWRSYTPDAAFELQDGSLVFDEFKATASSFSKPLVEAKVRAAAAVMASYGIQMRWRSGSELQHQPEHVAIKELWDVRRTKTSEADADNAREVISRAGGQTELGHLLGKLHPQTNIAFGIAAALMMRRVVRINLDRSLMPDSIVTIPPPAEAGNLRRFLARFAEKN